jgi:hypothetical protein
MRPWQGILSKGELASLLIPARGGEGAGAGARGTARWRGNGLGKRCYLRVLTVYFGTPNMLSTLWFGFDYGTNPPLGTLRI